MKDSIQTKTLIDELSKNISAVKPISETRLRFLQNLGAMLAGVILTFLLFSIRHDLSQVIDQRQFIVSEVVLLMGWMWSAYSLSLLRLPGVNSNRFLYFGLSLVAALSLGYFISGVIFSSPRQIEEGLSVGGGINCSLDILFLGIIPSLLMFLLIRRGAPTEISLAGFNVGLCSALLGAFMLQFSCSSTIPFHLLVWHILTPLGVLACLGIFISRKVLRW